MFEYAQKSTQRICIWFTKFSHTNHILLTGIQVKKQNIKSHPAPVWFCGVMGVALALNPAMQLLEIKDGHYLNRCCYATPILHSPKITSPDLSHSKRERETERNKNDLTPDQRGNRGQVTNSQELSPSTLYPKSQPGKVEETGEIKGFYLVLKTHMQFQPGLVI